MIVVIDTHVVISAFQFASLHSTPVRAIQKAMLVDTIATCNEIDVEILRILVDRFNWPPQSAEQRLAGIMENALRVTIPGALHLCRDPADDKFLECAERADADLLVTGDRDLLTLRTHGRTRIVTAADYLRA
ncbi:MAG TPA: putative toxin-antitoxin system toxin component, PIN family [Acidobacteriaceae bacterium]|jgi:putative PIN family toxin of toxin-antitoxin system|nr:putative toxin-antitoxin system toxin component, PIN family [Acidobacteriaceae bacterium]